MSFLTSQTSESAATAITRSMPRVGCAYETLGGPNRSGSTVGPVAQIGANFGPLRAKFGPRNRATPVPE